MNPIKRLSDVWPLIIFGTLNLCLTSITLAALRLEFFNSGEKVFTAEGAMVMAILLSLQLVLVEKYYAKQSASIRQEKE